MKLVVFLISLLILPITYSKVSDHSNSNLCRSCFWASDSSNFSSCLLSNCKSELLSSTSHSEKYQLQSFKPSCSLCEQQSEEIDTIQCLFTHCNRNLLERARILAIISPKIIHDRLPIKQKQCNQCFEYTNEGLYGFDCAYFNCRSEIVNKETLKSLSTQTQNSKCGVCLDYQGQDLLNCAYFYCKMEIESKISQFIKASGNTNKHSCKEGCYRMTLDEGVEYGDCVNYYCDSSLYNKTPFNEENKVAEMSNCDSCNYYFNNELLQSCAAKLCKEEILNPKALMSGNIKETIKGNENLSYCDDCESFWTSGEYDDYYECADWFCKSQISEVTLKFFAGKKSVAQELPIVSLKTCEKCVECYDVWDCLLFYCKEEVFDSAELSASSGVGELEEVELNMCTNTCVSEYGEQESNQYKQCIYNNCRLEGMAVYKKYLYSSSSSSTENIIGLLIIISLIATAFFFHSKHFKPSSLDIPLSNTPYLPLP